MNEQDIIAFKEQSRLKHQADRRLTQLGFDSLVTGEKHSEKRHKGYQGAPREELKRAERLAKRTMDYGSMKEAKLKNQEEALRGSGWLRGPVIIGRAK